MDPIEVERKRALADSETLRRRLAGLATGLPRLLSDATKIRAAGTGLHDI